VFIAAGTVLVRGCSGGDVGIALCARQGLKEIFYMADLRGWISVDRSKDVSVLLKDVLSKAFIYEVVYYPATEGIREQESFCIKIGRTPGTGVFLYPNWPD
jgi:hypothetical protein